MKRVILTLLFLAVIHHTNTSFYLKNHIEGHGFFEVFFKNPIDLLNLAILIRENETINLKLSDLEKRTSETKKGFKKLKYIEEGVSI